MTSLLPPRPATAVRTRKLALDEAALAGADAAVVILDRAQAASAVAQLPHAPLWRRLYASAARSGDGPPRLVARVPNARHTLVAVGFGGAGSNGFERLELAGKLLREVHQPGVASLRSFVAGLPPAAAAEWQEAVASAALAAAAPMPHWRSAPPPPSDLRRVELAADGAVAGLARAVAVAEGNHLARWLTTLPPNLLDCVSYRKALTQLARREGWTAVFHDEAALRRLGAGAFLAVSRANEHRGAGILRLGYRPRGRVRPLRIGLVGKGICFDTGGINLKHHKGMYEMHADMQGSAVAVGALLALARLGSPLAVDCWLALTENQIGPRAYRPQEVVRALNGVSIQVAHSDAEGRMVLADALALAAREQPRLLLDFATLTGACVNALTERYSGAFTNRDELREPLQAVGRSSGERVWCFPMDADYDTDLDSRVADVLQCTPDGKGDHILAARFLSRFVPSTVPWAHLDLAASERKGGLAHVPTDYTGFGVRYAVHLLDDPQFVAALGQP